MDGQNIYQPQTPTPVVPVPQVTPPAPKRRIPKIIIFILLGLVLLSLIFAAIKFLPKKTAGGGEITMWGLWEDEPTFAPLIAEYQQQNPGVKITYVRQSQQDYRERLTNSLAKGDGPDIFRFHNSWVPMLKSSLDYVPASVISPADFAKNYYPVMTSDLSSGTGIVGIPLMYDGLALFINQDIFDKAGKIPPTTWDELRITAKALTQKDDQGVITQAGVALGKTGNVDNWPEILALMMLQNGVSLFKPTGKLAEDALTFYTLFSTVDGVWDDTQPPSTVAFATGKLAMYIGPSWRAFEIMQQNPSLKFTVAPVPQVPKVSQNQPGITYATYWVEGVWAKSKNTQAAWDFLKFLSSKDSLTKLYTNASAQRQFGEPYPRTDMADLLKDQPILAPIISQAPNAESWYLDSRTFDGPTGINSQINKYFEDAVNAVGSGTPAAKALETVASGVSQVLAQYGMIAK
ncbi:extracellular solute-binding protein [Patescibacteria group bacterium]|nr:extracellular solute-binding protein [Patescibacteria group bacterium]